MILDLFSRSYNSTGSTLSIRKALFILLTQMKICANKKISNICTSRITIGNDGSMNRTTDETIKARRIDSSQTNKVYIFSSSLNMYIYFYEHLFVSFIYKMFDRFATYSFRSDKIVRKRWMLVEFWYSTLVLQAILRAYPYQKVSFRGFR